MSEPANNLLLDSLSEDCRNSLLKTCKPIELPLRTQLYWPEEMPQFGYFLTSGIASVVAGLEDGGTTEVGVIGREGLIGAFHLLGPMPALTECFMQVAGEGLRIPMDALRKAFLKHEEIRSRILEFVQAQNAAVSQVAACNKLHEAEPRLARWLLMMQDRMEDTTFHITQEFIGQMIGTRRTTINGVLASMERKGLLEHRRGQISIPDRTALELAACDCYPLITRTLRELYV